VPICKTIECEQSLNFLQRISRIKVGYKRRVASRETRESSEISESSGSLTVSGQRVVKYSIKIVSILRPLDYVFASPTENVKSRLVPTSLDDSFQKRVT